MPFIWGCEKGVEAEKDGTEKDRGREKREEERRGDKNGWEHLERKGGGGEREASTWRLLGNRWAEPRRNANRAPRLDWARQWGRVVGAGEPALRA